MLSFLVMRLIRFGCFLLLISVCFLVMCLVLICC